MITPIIFSKDRAAQLDLLIQSIITNANFLSIYRAFVLYKASNVNYWDGYELIKDDFGHINFIEETDFTKNLFYILDRCDEYTCLLTDDDIAYRKSAIDIWGIDNLFKRYDRLFSLSLRLGLNITLQDTYTGRECVQPSQTIDYGNFLIWDWTKMPPDDHFAYPFSVDGYIYRTEQLKELLSSFKFENPNSMEGRANRNALPLIKKYDLFDMAMLPESIIINTPLNRVQDECTNRFGETYGISTEELNRLYLLGQRPHLEAMEFNNINGVHLEQQLVCY